MAIVLLKVVGALCVMPAITTAMDSDSCPSSSTGGCCPPMFQRVGNACYHADFFFSTWEGVESFCRGIGGELAAPRSLEENELLKGMAIFGMSIWIGCNDMDMNGEWVCEGQEQGDTFWHWQPGQPLNQWDWFTERTDFCTVQHNSDYLSPEFDGKWKTAHCHRGKDRGICVYRPKRPRHYCFSTNSNRQLLNWCLVDHVIREFDAKSVSSCATACIIEPGCHSFNIKTNDHQVQKLCQLNNATGFDDPAKFEEQVDSDCNYFSQHFTLCSDEP